MEEAGFVDIAETELKVSPRIFPCSIQPDLDGMRLRQFFFPL